MKMIDGIPRRNRIDHMTPAELAIRAAVQAVEEAGADVLLTDAVILLGQAQAKVADYVDRGAYPRVTGPSKRQYELRDGALWSNWGPSLTPPAAAHWFPQASTIQEDVVAVAGLLNGTSMTAGRADAAGNPAGENNG